MKHGSLFSGIGGFDLAAQWAGIENIFQVEKDDWCRRVLSKNFPNSKQYTDIKNFNGKEYAKSIDIISGGFPCQPFSVAGQRKGKDDDRYLWEEMLRVISEIQPTYVIGENVTGIIGLALDTVLSDLEAQDYTTETFIIPACGKNAWHKRDRVWIVAYSNRIRRAYEQKETGQPIHNREWNCEAEKQTGNEFKCGISESGDNVSDTNSLWQLQPERINQNIGERTCNFREITADSNGVGRKNSIPGNEPTGKTSELRDSHSEYNANIWEVEPGVGRVVHGLSNRVDRIKGLGNAIVPQIAYEIFKSVQKLDSFYGCH